MSGFKVTGAMLWPLIYIFILGLVIFLLWKVRDRQPGNTRYSIAIYAGIGGCILLMLLGLWVFGVL